MSQANKILQLLLDGQPHRSDEITRHVFGTDDVQKVGLFRLGARIHDLKQKGYKIIGYKDKNPQLYWYQIIHNPFEIRQEMPKAEVSEEQARLL